VSDESGVARGAKGSVAVTPGQTGVPVKRANRRAKPGDQAAEWCDRTRYDGSANGKLC
jgi:hypothetical protein